MSGGDLFLPGRTTPAMAAAVSGDAWVAAMLRFEAALAAAQARVGLVPAAVAATIRAACETAVVDVDQLARDACESATPVVALVNALRRQVDVESAPYVHLGATSQDVLDTSMMLVSRAALDLLVDQTSALADACAVLAQRHRDTPMAGRTLLQRARPITFGFKAAMWMTAVDDAGARLRDFRGRRLAVQLGGAVGSQAGFGGCAAELTAAVAKELDLVVPDLPWQTDRGRVAELAAALGIAAGAAAKIALDVLLLSQSEVAEVAEAAAGRSSSMPHKRNAARSVQARAAFAAIPAQVATLVAAMAGELERPAGVWQSEAPALSEAFRLCAGAVARTREAITDLVVDAARMSANLGAVPAEDDVAAAAALVDRALGQRRGAR